jgi:alanyl-tRNA synthetase
LIRSHEQSLQEIGDLLRATPEEAAERVKRLLQQQKELEKEIERLRGQFGRNQIPDLLAKKQNISGTNVLITKVDGVDAKQLREIADQLKEKMGSGFIFLASPGENSVTLVSSVSPDLTKRVHAGNVIKEVAPIVGGGGGGRPDFAQAGGKEPSKTDEALKRVWEIINRPTIP